MKQQSDFIFTRIESKAKQSEWDEDSLSWLIKTAVRV